MGFNVALQDATPFSSFSFARRDRVFFCKCRVAANMLSIVQRELAQGGAADNAEQDGLESLLGRPSEEADTQSAIDDLNAELCAKIRSGELDDQREAVIAHTRRSLIDKVGIANPRYAGLPK